MIRDELSSIDLVEVLMAIEESFEVEIPDHDAEAISGPRETINWLIVHLAGKAMSILVSHKGGHVRTPMNGY